MFQVPERSFSGMRRHQSMEVVYNPSSIPVTDSVKIQLGISPNQNQCSKAAPGTCYLMILAATVIIWQSTLCMHTKSLLSRQSMARAIYSDSVFLHSCSALLAQVYWLQPRHPQRQKNPFFFFKCDDCPMFFGSWIWNVQCSLWFCTWHMPLKPPVKLVKLRLAHESHSQNVKSSCLSFIHIPKTGGGSIEFARIKAAGTEWNPRLSPDDRDGKCFEKVRHDRLSRFKGDHSHPNASFRFWGACDDQIQCSSDNATSTHCHFTTRAGALGRCSRWHVPPGLDVTVAASYTRNPFDKSSTCDTFLCIAWPHATIFEPVQLGYPFLGRERREMQCWILWRLGSQEIDWLEPRCGLSLCASSLLCLWEWWLQAWQTNLSSCHQNGWSWNKISLLDEAIWLGRGASRPALAFFWHMWLDAYTKNCWNGQDFLRWRLLCFRLLRATNGWKTHENERQKDI